MTKPWPFRISMLLLVCALLSELVGALLCPGANANAGLPSSATRLPAASLADGSPNCSRIPEAPVKTYEPGDVVAIGTASRRASRANPSRFVTGFSLDADKPRPSSGLVEITGSPLRVAGPWIGLGCFWPVRVLATGETGFVELIEGQVGIGSIPLRYLPKRP